MKKLMILAVAAIVVLSANIAMAQPPQGGKRPTAEQRVEQLTKQLDLSEEQSAAILKMEEERQMPERGDREAMKKMMEEEKAAMKEILTEDQYAEWEEMLAKQQQHGPRQ